MDFSFSDEQNQLRSLAEKILQDQSTLERLKAIEESDDRVDRDTWGKLGEAGLIGVALPEEYGGAGYGLVELCILLEEVGRAVAHVPVLATAAYAGLPLAHFGTDAQKAAHLNGVATGEKILTAALSEALTDPRTPNTTATKSGGGYRLDGQKIGVPVAKDAHVVLVPAAVDGGGVAVFLVDPRAAGVKLESQETTNWEGHYAMTLDGVEVAADAVLGSIEKGTEVLDWIIDHATVALCATASGVVDKALHITAGYAAERKQFDKPLSEFQAVSQRMGDSYIDHQALNVTMWQAVTRLAEGVPCRKEIAVAKYWAAEAGHRVGHAGLHIHGGISIDVDYPIQRYYLWAKQIEGTLGAATPQLLDLGSQFAAE